MVSELNLKGEVGIRQMSDLGRNRYFLKQSEKIERRHIWGTFVNLGPMVCKGQWPEELNEVG